MTDYTTMSTLRSPDGSGAASPCLPPSSVKSSGDTEPDSDSGLIYAPTRSSLTRRLLRLRACSSPVKRRKREMIPTYKKDATYWDKRQRNNEAAKRSREKKRLQDLMLEGQVLALSDENAQLRAQVHSLQYHSSLNAEKSNPRAASATSDSALPFPLRPPYPHGLFQAGLWSNSRSNHVSALGVRQEEAVMQPFEAKIPCFSASLETYPTYGAQQEIPSLSRPCFFSPRALPGVGRSAEAEMDPQRQVSTSDDIPGSIRAFPDTLSRPSILSYPPKTWLVPGVNHSAVRNSLLLPWRSTYLSPSAVYPGFYLQERAGQGLSVQEELQRGFQSRFSSVPAGLNQPGMHLSPYGR
ncbi:uncharacterized protein si:dkey-172o19.2 [Notolabrus celidotus]|uniref:uncharacterized protein si:dkey-172o19.2 n=1 Tax=Notolabrus celidotus TaxID=1203425 RepID=UPI0014901925|nr:uncharacterized protein si:dkey-172o19.2 [Notolabrus celidotus]